MPYQEDYRWGSVSTYQFNGYKRHGLTGTVIWRVWSAMMQRCTNPNHSGWDKYGGRGIKVCDQWWVFENFYADMAPSWKQGLTLGRIENNGNYEPSNCEWQTPKVQSRNTRRTRLVEFNGQIKSLAEWAEIAGLNYFALRSRLDAGWPMDKAMTQGLNRTIEYGGKKMNLKEWSKHLHVSRTLLANRLDVLGWTVEKTLTTPCLKTWSRHPL